MTDGKKSIKMGNKLLTSKDLTDIITRRENGEFVGEIAEDFNLNQILLSEFLNQRNISPQVAPEIVISGKKFKLDEMEEIFQRRKVGEPVIEIAKDLGLDEKRLAKVFQYHNIQVEEKLTQKLGGKTFSRETIDEICNRRINGEKIKDIAYDYDLAPNTLTKFFIRHNIKKDDGFKGKKVENVIKNSVSHLKNERRSKLDKLLNDEVKILVLGGRKFTKEEISNIILRRKNGEMLKVFEDEFNISHRVFQYFFSTNDIHPITPEGTIKLGNRFISNDIIEKVKEKRLKGHSIRSLSKEFNINKDVLRKFLIKEGITLSEEKLRNIGRKYTINHDFFSNDEISSSNEAYIIGLIMADGSLDKQDKTVEICLHKNDKYLLEKINEVLGSNRPIYYPKKDKRARLRFNSSQIYEDLKRKGIDESTKSYTSKVPSSDILKEPYQNDFIRGVFDGDGSISINEEKHYYNFCLIGSKNLLETIQEILMRKCDLNKTRISPAHKNNFNYFNLAYGGLNNIAKIYKYLYNKDDNNKAIIFLKRKHNKMEKAYLRFIKRQNRK
ncbi:MAG: LAGLIDADG family homing endonuclease [Candidatus Hodarchaeota archaeon]